MTRVLNILGNSGSGKTILAVNLAFAFAKRGVDTILIDGNIYSPDVAYYLNISPLNYLNEFLKGEKSIDQTFFYHPEKLRIIPSMPEDEHNPIFHDRINQALVSLIGKSELVIVDSFSQSPALFSVLHQSDESIFMTNDDFPSIIKTREFVKKAENKGISIIGVVLNKKRPGTNIKHIESIIGKSVLTNIPHDESIINSFNKRRPAFLHYNTSPVKKSAEYLAGLLDISNR